ncbi:MAG: RNA polymerase sigma factor [Anaerolineales bacterium]
MSETFLKNAFPSTYSSASISIEDEAALLKAARQLDQAALASIFDSYAPALYGYILRLCHDPEQADQIVGDVFSKLLEKLADGKGPHKNLRSYLYQIAYHLFIDQTRYDQHIAPIEIVEYISGETSTVQDEIENRALLDTVLLAINNDLTVDQRHVIVLRFLEGMNLQETAKVVGKSVNNVKVLQNRGVEKIRKVLGLRDQ